jgi:hypothetical protein
VKEVGAVPTALVPVSAAAETVPENTPLVPVRLGNMFELPLKTLGALTLSAPESVAGAETVSELLNAAVLVALSVAPEMLIDGPEKVMLDEVIVVCAVPSVLVVVAFTKLAEPLA